MKQTDPVISVYITNLGKYNEGELAGEWHPLPTTKEEVQAVLERIGIDGVQYEEVFFTDYESSIDGLQKAFSEYMNLDEVNYLAIRLDELSSYELESFATIVGTGDFASTIPEFINLTESLDVFTIYDGIENEEDLGTYFLEESGVYDLESLGTLANYIDHEAFGCDIHLDLGGGFSGGNYVEGDYGDLSRSYRGSDDIPDECKVFYYPEAGPSQSRAKDISNRRQNNRDDR